MLLVMVLSLAFAGAAVAQPSGPGGTIYFVENFYNGPIVANLNYLDIDSNWAAIGTPTNLSTVAPLGGSTGTGMGAGVWFNPATGLQNETALHSGYIALNAEFSSVRTLCPTNSGTGQGNQIVYMNPHPSPQMSPS